MRKIFRKPIPLQLLSGIALLTFGIANSQAQSSASVAAENEAEAAAQARTVEVEVQAAIEQSREAAEEARAAAMASLEAAAEAEAAPQARSAEAEAQVAIEQSRAAAEEARAAAIASREEAIEVAGAAIFTAQLAEQEAQIAEAQRQVEEASRVMAEVAEALAAQRSDEQGSLAESRAELSRAHRALSEASREVARAHRELARGESAKSRFRVINLGDRAVIGVLLGESNERGVELAGVSPGGPAEKAGLKKGDVLTSIREVDLTDQPGKSAREALMSAIAEVKPGDEIRIGFMRDGNNQKLIVKAEQREPSSWQSMIRLPEAPAAPGAPAAPAAPGAHAPPHSPVAPGDTSSSRVVIRQGPGAESRVVVIDEAALAERIAEIEKRVESFHYMFTDEDGIRIEFEENFNFDDEQFSSLGGEALHQANMWFGQPQAAGLELASCNPELGSYFKTDRGVLVLKVDDDNSYGLKTGDVILSVEGDEVNTPAELIRALRNFSPGAEFELQIKRERRDKTLQAVLPDSRLGALMGFGFTPEQHP